MERHAGPEADALLDADQQPGGTGRSGRQAAPDRSALGGAEHSHKYALGWGERPLAEGDACWQATLDLNADGTSNGGPQPREVKISEGAVNALAIGIGASVRVDHAETDLAGR
ncbi:hypothetical protein NHU_01586 [Rhodovulum sulfidophilum]|uniref:Uncharacterized protein n=1 Tax=Rhodovulum sulfidophilum TaxID=35806 RepID=A0A0D6B222_RHOSU|nr:hypothetical protein NHU_01586 [Rhodovulum sulfidophilum]